MSSIPDPDWDRAARKTPSDHFLAYLEIVAASHQVPSIYDPVSVPSKAQLELMKVQEVDPSEYAALDYSPEFKARFGTPILYQSEYAAMTNYHDFNKFLAPNMKGSFLNFARKTSFLAFCKSSDATAVKANSPVLGRFELECTWVQELHSVFIRQEEDSMRALMMEPSANFTRRQVGKHMTEDESRSVLKSLYKKAIEKRHTSKGLEHYWTTKAQVYGIPDLDVTGFPVNHWETPDNTLSFTIMREMDEGNGTDVEEGSEDIDIDMKGQKLLSVETDMDMEKEDVSATAFVIRTK